MRRSVVHQTFRLILCLGLLAGLAACGGGGHSHHTAKRGPTKYYPPPGPSNDPWGPYIREASGRFGVPEVWVRRVMRQESGGQEDVISWAGAMGLMQVMPETYDELRERHQLGDDPFEPHNNILAGTAYLREMYDRYGAPGFLAAYNAGPSRVDRYLNNGVPLPTETVNYVASIAPLLGPATPMSGPLAVYAYGRQRGVQVASRVTPSGCDPDVAFNPDGPCTKLVSPALVRTVAARPSATEYCDPDAAYDPARRCLPAPPAAVVAEAVEPVGAAPVAPRPMGRYVTAGRPIQERMGLPVTFTVPPPLPRAEAPPGRWMIQVGAFATLSIAQSVAEKARSTAPDLLRMTKIELPATAPLGTQVAFRARLAGLSAETAADACARLTLRGMACMTVPPGEVF